MTDSTYLQRLIARMGMPSAGTMPANAPSLALPEAPVPPVYNPFAEAEAPDEGQTSPPTVDPQVTPEQSLPLPPAPAIREESAAPLPLEKETTREVISIPPERTDVQPPSGVEAITRGADLPSPQPADQFGEVTLSMPQEPATTERVVYTTIEKPLPDSPSAHTVSDGDEAGDLLPPQEPETVERVIPEHSAPPQVEAPEIFMEPPPTPDVPEVTSVLAPPAPQITIGEIVVEIVSKSEKPAIAPLPRPSGVRPSEAPAQRAGVRSKRGFGLGQI